MAGSGDEASAAEADVGGPALCGYFQHPTVSSRYCLQSTICSGPCGGVVDSRVIWRPFAETEPLPMSLDVAPS